MLELTCETQVAAQQQADIVDAIAHHHQAGEPKAKRKAAPLFGIDAAHAQYVGMHQAAGQQFHPPAPLTHRATGSAADQALDVELEPRFHEPEVSRTQPHHHVALEDRAQQRLHEIDHVGDGDVLIHHHAFELIESVLVAFVHLFISEYAARSNHA